MQRILGLIVILVLMPLLGSYLHAPVEEFRLHSPDGRYTAIVTSSRFWQLASLLPEQRFEQRGYVQINNHDGKSLGRIPIPSLSRAQDLQWIAHGARIKEVGAWNFEDGFYAYWNDDQTFVHTEQVN